MRSWKIFLLLFLLSAFSRSAPGENFKPNLGPDRPRITIQCGNLTLLLRQSSQWTPARIDFCGVPMTTEQSAYGTVFLFPGVGFIGTNHLENEPEELKSLSFWVDGKAVADPGETLSGGSFRFLRESRIRSFLLINETELKKERLYETTSVSTTEAAPLSLVYHFMHAWKPSVSAYLAGMDSQPGDIESGLLQDHAEAIRKFHLQKPVDWVAVFEPESGHFAVSRLLESPLAAGHSSKIWNVPGTYRKHYLTSFANQTVPAGFSGTWRMVTAFGKSSPDQWKDAAVRLAGELRE